MKHRVRLTDKAEHDIDSVLLWFHDQSAAAAGTAWFAQLMAAIDTLESHPERCGLAAESVDLGLEIRELLVGKHRGKHRVLFQVVGSTVYILRVRHSSRDAIARFDL